MQLCYPLEMQKIEITAQPRTISGRGVKQLRTQGILPAVLYGRGFEALNIQLPIKEFQKVYAEAGESTMIYVKLGEERYPAIIQDVTVDPVGDHVLHADFYKVRLDEKIKAKVPVVIVGEAPAVKSLGGILVRNINEIEVEGFPQDLPHQFEVDISKLEQFGSHVQVSDIQVPANIELKANPEEIIALVQAPISEEELKAQLEAPAGGIEDVEVIKKEEKEAEVGDDTAAPAEAAKEEPKK